MADSPHAEEPQPAVSIRTRRRFLQAASATALASAGCLDGGSSSGTGASPATTASPGGDTDVSYQTTTFEEFSNTLGVPFQPVAQVSESPIEQPLSAWPAPAIDLPRSDDYVTISGWGGEADCSATVRLAYDDRALYVGVDVTDDTHSPAGTRWQGDSVQVGFAPNGEYGPGYVFAHTDDGPDVRINNRNVESRGPGAVDLRTSRSNDRTTYRAAIPWGAVGQGASPPAFVPFGLIVNDNDGSGRRGWLEYTHAIATNRDPSNLARLGAVPADRSWNPWLEGPRETTTGATTQFTLSVPNYGDDATSVTVNAPALPAEDAAIDVPAQSIARIPLEITPGSAGSRTVTATVSDGAGTEVTVERTVSVVEVSGTRSRLADVESQLPALDSKVADAEAQGLAIDYERVNATTVEHFIQYARQDIDNGRYDRAAYMAEECERLLTEATQAVDSYLDGDEEPLVAPRYRAGQPDVEDLHFEADTSVTGQDGTDRRTTFFNGYGGFNQAREMISEFHDLGANVVHQGLGAGSTIAQPEGGTAWNWEPRNGANVEFTVDDEVAHSGERSLRIHNETESGDGFGLVHQQVAVEPETTYEFSIWAKGETVGKSRIVADWDETTSLSGGNYDWEQVTLTVETDPHQNTLNVKILNGEATEALWIDDVSFRLADGGGNLLEDPSFENAGDAASGRDFLLNEGPIEGFVSTLDEAAANDVSVVVMNATHRFPQWAIRKWDLAVDQIGFYGYNIYHPKARAMVEAHTRAVAGAIGDHDALHSICLSNEPIYFRHDDPVSQRQWRDFLAERHGDVETMNAHYDAEYDSFEAVPQPDIGTIGRLETELPFDPSPRTYDWVRFNNRRLADYHQWMADLIHEEAPDVAVHSKINTRQLRLRPPLLVHGVDPEQFAHLSNINGQDNHTYLDDGVDEHFEYQKVYDMQTSMRELPVFNSENHLIANGNHQYIPDQRKHLRTAIWQGAVHGCSASSLWLWRRTYQPEQHQGAVGSIANRPDAVATLGHTTLDMNRLSEELVALQDDEASVAILYSVTAHHYSEAYLPAVDAAYDTISSLGVDVDFVSENQIADGDLADYELFVCPMATHVPSDVPPAIAEAVSGEDLDVLAIGADDELLARDEYGHSLPTGDRDAALESATHLDPDASMDRVRRTVRGLLDDHGLTDVLVLDADTGEPASDVEWRSVEHDGRLLVNVANYAREATSIRLTVDGEAVSEARDLIDAENVAGEEWSLPGLTPRLFAVDP